MATNQEPLFVYGSMLDQEVLECVLGRAVEPGNLAPASIEGYRRLRLPDELVRTLIQQAQLRATMGLLQEGCQSEQEVDALLDELESQGDLTQAVALKALSDGDIYFFEAAMARMANIPVENARELIHEEGRLGLQSLLKKVADQ